MDDYQFSKFSYISIINAGETLALLDAGYSILAVTHSGDVAGSEVLFHPVADDEHGAIRPALVTAACSAIFKRFCEQLLEPLDDSTAELNWDTLHQTLEQDLGVVPWEHAGCTSDPQSRPESFYAALGDAFVFALTTWPMIQGLALHLMRRYLDGHKSTSLTEVRKWQEDFSQCLS